jgi:hypothetical protein
MNKQAHQPISEAYGIYSSKYASVLEPILKPIAEEILDIGRTMEGDRLLDLATGSGLIAEWRPSQIIPFTAWMYLWVC